MCYYHYGIINGTRSCAVAREPPISRLGSVIHTHTNLLDLNFILQTNFVLHVEDKLICACTDRQGRGWVGIRMCNRQGWG